MPAPKILVLFYTTYGTNHAIAQTAAAAARDAGAEVRVVRVAETVPQHVIDGQEGWKAQIEKMKDIPEATHDDMIWADGYFISSPTRYGNMASQLRAFIDGLGPLWQKGQLANKTLTATTSAQTLHGGHESTLLSMYITAAHWGAIIVPPGYADPVKFEDGGNPYGFSMQAGELDEVAIRSISFQARRLAEMTARLVV